MSSKRSTYQHRRLISSPHWLFVDTRASNSLHRPLLLKLPTERIHLPTFCPNTVVRLPTGTLHTVRMDCFADYCLNCDRQTYGTPFCSQACRLAELDHSQEPTSPSYTNNGSGAQMTQRALKSGFYLPPAFDFSMHRTSRMSPASQLNTLSTVNTRPSQPTSNGPSTLSPASSQTSLSSVKTAQSTYSKLSEQAENDLKEYSRSFDQVRSLRRRISLL